LGGHIDVVVGNFVAAHLASDSQMELLRSLALCQIQIDRIRRAKELAFQDAEAGSDKAWAVLGTLQGYERKCLSLRKAIMRRLDEIGAEQI
jgi:hypothetical protein